MRLGTVSGGWVSDVPWVTFSEEWGKKEFFLVSSYEIRIVLGLILLLLVLYYSVVTYRQSSKEVNYHDNEKL